MTTLLKTRGRMRAEEKFQKLYLFNKGKGGKYGYIHLKMMSDGGFVIGLSKGKSKAKNLLKQKKLGRIK